MEPGTRFRFQSQNRNRNRFIDHGSGSVLQNLDFRFWLLSKTGVVAQFFDLVGEKKKQKTNPCMANRACSMFIYQTSFMWGPILFTLWIFTTK